MACLTGGAMKIPSIEFDGGSVSYSWGIYLNYIDSTGFESASVVLDDVIVRCYQDQDSLFPVYDFYR